MKKEDEKKYLYYLISIGTMPRISVSKHEIRSKIDRTVVYKIGEVVKRNEILKYLIKYWSSWERRRSVDMIEIIEDAIPYNIMLKMRTVHLK